MFSKTATKANHSIEIKRFFCSIFPTGKKRGMKEKDLKSWAVHQNKT
jgi:hypothetical protein